MFHYISIIPIMVFYVLGSISAILAMLAHPAAHSFLVYCIPCDIKQNIPPKKWLVIYPEVMCIYKDISIMISPWYPHLPIISRNHPSGFDPAPLPPFFRPVEVAHPEAIPGQISTEAQDGMPRNLWHEIWCDIIWFGVCVYVHMYNMYIYTYI